MDMNKQTHVFGHRKLNAIVTALAFIVVGVMILGRNLGWVDPHIFRIVISWQMLLIVIGITHLIKQQFTSGLIMLAVGGFFLVPVVSGIDRQWFHMYWPAIFIIVGIVMLIKHLFFKSHSFHHKHHDNFTRTEGTSENGFVKADVSFGNVKHIVLDPVFRGADIDVSFGSAVLDLRKTSLDAPQTYIDVDCSFGGVQLFIPSHWNVVCQTNTTLGGCDDKRYAAQTIDYDQQLIIRGDITFSGLEIKN
ncbi:putative membrane protein [Parabacteroides sp. PF5-5]|uniref:LiaF transmembrane domain-containing protein n=1 Tax=unclassified Parabacteroides TaxID=2649774 RepID=UPI002475D7E0|nr:MULTISPECIES: DUF5668 domain-containing protein [unclassified Parabacteroides]MDH6304999.1 putative membrane protein [Parabacteroides sp. PH5-39]MDH6315916.1 putative membrane protein [Parabacteroides sp. PF5-13]MDH6319573.1 putative membrane protein [Parabacteroides sp. PH5-13]MDH6323304.1 putative membrane protein [Parabacteroides sp. PH5-8]MDH6327188.1 putative membrane protein [Parabacteroides sp. PH5-41]